MTLLVDTDAFCKLGLARLLEDAAAVLGGTLGDCGRLAALPRMLGRGRLVRTYGSDMCATLRPLAERMPAVPQPSNAWLDVFAHVESIDPGEVQLFAASAEYGLMVLSGDKRATRALRHVDRAHDALNHRVVSLEAMLLALHERLGPTELARRLAPVLPFDGTLRMCFSTGGSGPLPGLLSYYRSQCSDVAPLQLWHPPATGPS